MTRYEYKVVPAPRKGEKARGVKTAEDRFAHAMSSLMNTLGRDGWDYVRSDTLPVEEKSGWLSRATTGYQSVLVFRRAIEAEFQPERGRRFFARPDDEDDYAGPRLRPEPDPRREPQVQRPEARPEPRPEPRADVRPERPDSRPPELRETTVVPVRRDGLADAEPRSELRPSPRPPRLGPAD